MNESTERKEMETIVKYYKNLSIGFDVDFLVKLKAKNIDMYNKLLRKEPTKQEVVDWFKEVV